MPSAAFAADPTAIPGNALPECGTEAVSGGWALRNFASIATDVATSEPAGSKGLRLGEPCLVDNKIQVPTYVLDLRYNEDGEDVWTGGGGSGDDDDPNCPTVKEGYDRSWVTPASAYCVGVPLKIGTGYKPDGAPYNGGTFELLTEQYGPGSYFPSHPDSTKYTATYDPIKPSGSPYPGGALQVVAMCRYEGTNNWDNPESTADMPQIALYDGVPVDLTFYMRKDCNGLKNPSHTGGPFGDGSFGTTDEPPVLYAYRSVGTSTASGADATYYGNIITALHKHGSIADSGAGANLNGLLSATIRLNDNAIAPNGYYVCATTAAGNVTANIPMTTGRGYDRDYPPAMNDPEAYNPEWTENIPLIGDQPCAYLKEIHLSVCIWSTNSPTGYGCTETVWTYGIYTNGNPYGDGDTPGDSFCQYMTTPTGQCVDILFPDPNKPEAAIVCTINYSDPGNPITNIGEFFGGLPNFVGCLFTPKGWDRAGKIEKTWTNGPVGKLTAAFTEAVPEGIVCGDLVTLPLLEGQSLELDTCNADFAPDIAKTVVGWIFVMGLCVLIVKRIMWSVGGGK